MKVPGIFLVKFWHSRKLHGLVVCDLLVVFVLLLCVRVLSGADRATSRN